MLLDNNYNKIIKIFSILIYCILFVLATVFNSGTLFFDKAVHITGFIITIAFLSSKILLALVNVSCGNILYSLFILIGLIAWKMYTLEFWDNDVLSFIPLIIIMPYAGLKYIFSTSTISSFIIVFALFLLALEIILVYKKKRNKKT